MAVVVLVAMIVVAVVVLPVGSMLIQQRNWVEREKFGKRVDAGHHVKYEVSMQG